MNTSPRFALLAALVSLVAVACSADTEGSPAAGDPGVVPGSTPGTTPPVPGVTPDIAGACTAQFDALAARFKKCGRDAVMGMLPLESSRAGFVKSCMVQSSRPGTSYSVAQRKVCTAALASTTCTGDEAIMNACIALRGELSKGLPCNVDDQCKDGYCALPSGAKPGSSCGMCATPVWKELDERCRDERDPEVAAKSRCKAGAFCSESDICAPTFKIVDPFSSIGRSCATPGLASSCYRGTYCRASVCAALPSVGESCATAACVRGLLCDATTKVCTGYGSDGQPATLNTDSVVRCDEWTRPSATGKCEVQAALNCN